MALDEGWTYNPSRYPSSRAWHKDLFWNNKKSLFSNIFKEFIFYCSIKLCKGTAAIAKAKRDKKGPKKSTREKKWAKKVPWEQMGQKMYLGKKWAEKKYLWEKIDKKSTCEKKWSKKSTRGKKWAKKVPVELFEECCHHPSRNRWPTDQAWKCQMLLDTSEWESLLMLIVHKKLLRSYMLIFSLLSLDGKRCFFFRDPVFWGGNFLIWRRKFPNIEEEFLNMEEEFS